MRPLKIWSLGAILLCACFNLRPFKFTQITCSNDQQCSSGQTCQSGHCAGAASSTAGGTSGGSSGGSVGQYDVIAKVTGLPIDSALTLANGTDTLVVEANGAFSFPTLLAAGASYAVTIQSMSPAAIVNCTLGNTPGVIVAGPETVTVSCESFTLNPLYPKNGAAWNDYVINDGPDIFSAQDVACTASTGASYMDCVHGGEMRSVEVLGQSDCAPLTAQDSLTALRWACVQTAPNVSMVSIGLQPDKNLSDLIDFTAAAWLPMSVTVYNGATAVAATVPAPWQTNPIATYGSGTEAGTIYIVNSPVPAGFCLFPPVDHAALLVKPGLVAPLDASCGTFSAPNADFAWVEGTLDGTLADGSFGFSGTFCVARNVTANSTSANTPFVSFNNVRSRYHHLRFANHGTLFLAGSGDLIDDLVWSNSSGNPAIEDVGNRNVVNDLRMFNNTHALSVDGSDETYARTLVASGANGAIVVTGSAVLIGTSAALSGGVAGVLFSGTDNSTVVGLGVFGNSDGTTPALSLDATRAPTGVNENFADVAVANSGTGTPDLVAVGPNPGNGSFSGILIVGNTCTTGTPSSFFTGLGPIANGACSAAGGTNATIQQVDSQFSITTLFVGAALTESANTSPGASTGVATSATGVQGLDWFNFDNIYQGWGAVTANVPLQPQCTASQSCQIWDYRLSPASSRPTTVLALPVTQPPGPAADAELIVHNWQATVADDCDLIPGAVFGISTCQSIFLRRAIEIIGDGIGNENGLCESNEDCIYSPNMAAYQGEGALTLVPGGPISIGSVVNVTLWQYAINGG